MNLLDIFFFFFKTPFGGPSHRETAGVSAVDCLVTNYKKHREQLYQCHIHQSISQKQYDCGDSFDPAGHFCLLLSQSHQAVWILCRAREIRLKKTIINFRKCILLVCPQSFLPAMEEFQLYSKQRKKRFVYFFRWLCQITNFILQ